MPKHRVCEQVADAVRAGGRGYQVQTAARGVELAERTTGFQRSCDNAVVHQLAFHDMRGAADRRIYRADLAAVELERDVVLASGQIDVAPGRTASAIETTGGSGS